MPLKISFKTKICLSGVLRRIVDLIQLSYLKIFLRIYLQFMVVNEQIGAMNCYVMTKLLYKKFP